MFPDVDMLGVDLVLPDFTWLRERADRVEGGHPHPRPRGPRRVAVLPAPRADPGARCIGSQLTLGLARGRIEEAGLAQDGRSSWWSRTASGARSARSTASSCRSPTRCRTGSPPRSTPTQGTILHTGDFKLDLTPVDGRLTDLARIGGLASGDGIRLLLSDEDSGEPEDEAPAGVAAGGAATDDEEAGK